MLIRVAGQRADPDVRVQVHSSTATLGDLAGALEFEPGTEVAVGDEVLAESTALTPARVPDGTTLGRPPIPQPAPGWGMVALHVVGGLDAGRWIPVSGGPIRVGRAADNDLVLGDPSVSRQHCVIDIQQDGATVRDLQATNGTYLGGLRLASGSSGTAAIGVPIECGSAMVILRQVKKNDRPVGLARWAASEGMGVPFFRQPPNEPLPEAVVLDVPVEPKAPGVQPFYLAALLMPLVLAGVMFFVVGHGQLKNAYFALFALMTPVMMGFNQLSQRHRRRSSMHKGKRSFGKEMLEFENELAETCQVEASFRREAYVDLPELVRWADLPSARLWERRPGHPLFGQVMLGTGDVPWQPALTGGDLAPAVSDALKRIGVLPGVPISQALAAGRVVGLVGPRDSTLAVARAMIMQACTLHGPADLVLCLLAVGETRADWDWTKWIPHAALADEREARLLFDAGDATEPWVGELARFEDRQFVLAVLDAASQPDIGYDAARAMFRSDRPAAGIVVAESVDALPDVCDPVVTLDPSGEDAVVRPRRGRPLDMAACGAAPETALTWATALARYRDPERTSGMSQLPDDARLISILGLGGAEPPELVKCWEGQRSTKSAWVPLALGADGPVGLDLAGPLPNLLALGAAGTGKTELLRAATIAASTTFRPSELHIVVIGRELEELRSLPHVAAFIGEMDDAALSRLVMELDAEREDAAGRRLLLVIDELPGSGAAAPVAGPGASGGAQSLARWLRLHRAEGVHVVAGASRVSGLLEQLADVPAVRVLLRPPIGFDPSQWLHGITVGAPTDLRAGSAIWSTGRGPSPSVQIGCTFLATPRPRSDVEIDPFRFDTAGRRPEPRSAAGEPDADVLARLITAAVTLAGEERAEPLRERDAPEAVSVPTLPELLGIEDLATLKPVTTWRGQTVEGLLRVPIGLSEDGAPFEIDLKEAALGGMGPHGLVVGATGSGKSELLRTIVMALALTHSPEELNLVLVDYKGGATFAGMADLPQLAGMVDSLEGDLGRVDRVGDALGGEMRRRMGLLREAGNAENLIVYRKRAVERNLDPLPHLLVVIDEFVELLIAFPDFIDVLASIGRVGRSVGVHLILASQQMEEGRLRGVDKNIRCRVALRTQTPAESRVAIGVPDAASLPSTPGNGILQVDSILRRFRASYVSGPLPAGDGVTSDGRSMLDIAVARLGMDRQSVHQVWMDELPASIPLGRFLGAPVRDPDRGLVMPDWPGVGRLAIPVGLLDLPSEQRQAPQVIELGGGGGNLVVVGAPQSGKSTFLKTVVLGLSLTHTPTEVACYLVDMGGALSALGALPHVGSVAAAGDRELVARMLAQVSAVIAKRQLLFKEHGIDSVARFRALRSQGELPEQALGDVFLVIDGWAAFRQEYEGLEAEIISLAAQGLGFGVHVLVSAGGWMEVKSKLLDSLGSRFELRLNNPADSQIDRRAAAGIPSATPGRALVASKHSMQLAFPTVEAQDGGPLSTTEGVAAAAAAAWGAEGAPPVRLLPGRVDLGSLPQPGADTQPGVPFGIGESDMGPAYLDLVGGDPHFLVFGDSESGKTTFLATLAAGVVDRSGPDRARFVVVDYRRALLDSIPSEYLEAYCGAQPAVVDAVTALASSLTGRLPGAEVTTSQLRARSWWSGPDYFVLVDDYDLVATGSQSPLQPLLDLVAQGRDVGLHLVITRRVAGASRGAFEPVLARVREISASGLILAGDRGEGALIGVHRAGDQPAGRGIWVRRREGAQLVQVATVG